MSSEASTGSSSSSSSNMPPPSLEELDKSMFGDVNVKLADALTEFCATALRSGVESLPLLQRRQELLVQLGKPYLKHLDMIEAYAGRRIFTVKYAGGGPRRRHQIVKRFLGQEQPLDLSQTSTTATKIDTPTAVTVTTQLPLSVNDLPSEEERKNLDAELELLAAQLKEATLRRNLLLKQCADLHVTHQWTSSIEETIQASSISGSSSSNEDDDGKDNHTSIHESISAAVVGGQGLQDIIREGTKLQMELEERNKLAMMEESGDAAAMADGEALAFPKLRSIKRRGSVVMTSEDLYRHERQTVKVSRKGVDALLLSSTTSSSSSSKENVVN